MRAKRVYEFLKTGEVKSSLGVGKYSNPLFEIIDLLKEELPKIENPNISPNLVKGIEYFIEESSPYSYLYVYFPHARHPEQIYDLSEIMNEIGIHNDIIGIFKKHNLEEYHLILPFSFKFHHKSYISFQLDLDPDKFMLFIYKKSNG